jgi:hypothetical protein
MANQLQYKINIKTDIIRLIYPIIKSISNNCKSIPNLAQDNNLPMQQHLLINNKIHIDNILHKPITIFKKR